MLTCWNGTRQPLPEAIAGIRCSSGAHSKHRKNSMVARVMKEVCAFSGYSRMVDARSTPDHFCLLTSAIEYNCYSVDVYGLGNTFYGMLTGLYPFPTDVDRINVTRRIAYQGEHTFLDPRYHNRSLIEGRLVALIELMLQPQLKDRISIFEVVRYLEETQRLVEAQQA
jgi:serine/threonine protein kinase